MFAIIDIETTGLRPENNKIIDICIIIHDGLYIIEKFSSLIHPERYISSNITKLTGITNEMVAGAPKFYEIAKKIIELTQGRIFVAHNASFDYGFVVREFKSLGYSYKREKLCTVRLSRKLIPGKVSYSLGRLCDSLGIMIEDRHRAEGDAVATAKLFDLLLFKKNNHPIYRKVGIDSINATRIDSVKANLIKKLPEETGVYYFLDNTNHIIYVGKSNNIRTRALGHLSSDISKAKKMLFSLYDVDFILTGSELIALLFEAEEIKNHQPIFNKRSKQSLFTHSLEWFIDSLGILNFNIVPYEDATNPIFSFINNISAREKLNELIDSQKLCLKYCGVDDAEGECFNFQIKRCNGICCGKESISDYNIRGEKVIEDFKLPHTNFVIIEEGRTIDEKSFVLVENNNYSGYGYFDNSVEINSPKDFKNYILPFKFFPDLNLIIKQYLKKHPMIKILSWK